MRDVLLYEEKGVFLQQQNNSKHTFIQTDDHLVCRTDAQAHV